MDSLMIAGIGCLLLGAVIFFVEPALDKKGLGKLASVSRLTLFIAGAIMAAIGFFRGHAS